MTFLWTSLSESTILETYLVLIGKLHPEPPNFLNASHSCVPLLTVVQTFTHRTFSLLPAGLRICISMELIFLLKAYGTKPKLLAHLFTTAFQRSSFEVIQKTPEPKKHGAATSCPSRIDLPVPKRLHSKCSRVWSTGNTDCFHSR